jgi:lipoyl(octanoyl) transferase
MSPMGRPEGESPSAQREGGAAGLLGLPRGEAAGAPSDGSPGCGPRRPPLQVEWLGRVQYQPTWDRMRAFTAHRTDATPDALWIVEHPPVFTLGQAGRREHLLAAGDIPVVPTDRGGQVTYHGPGQVLVYALVDLRRLGIYVKELVFRIEQAVVQTLAGYGLDGRRVAGAPGIYVNAASVSAASGEFNGPDAAGLASRSPLASVAAGDADPAGGGDPGRFAGLAKIAALGIKVSRGCSTHGVALNVAMDLAPFDRIDPCGYAGLRVTDLATCGVQASVRQAGEQLALRLAAHLDPPVPDA